MKLQFLIFAGISVILLSRPLLLEMLESTNYEFAWLLSRQTSRECKCQGLNKLRSKVKFSSW